MIKVDDFTKWLGILLAEAFGVSDASSGQFLDTGRSGLLGTINAISAETASTALKPENATITSHCTHVLYLLHLFDAYERGQNPAPDWEASWKMRTVDETEWSRLRAELQTAYSTVSAQLLARTAWDEPRLAASMMLLAHCAYHIGEIRQLLTSITP